MACAYGSSDLANIDSMRQRKPLEWIQEQCKCNAAERLNPNELDVLTSFLDAMSLDVQEFVVQGAECNPNSTRIRCFDGKVEAL